jgi:hypothetical protein
LALIDRSSAGAPKKRWKKVNRLKKVSGMLRIPCQRRKNKERVFPFKSYMRVREESIIGQVAPVKKSDPMQKRFSLSI